MEITMTIFEEIKKLIDKKAEVLFVRTDSQDYIEISNDIDSILVLEFDQYVHIRKEQTILHLNDKSFIETKEYIKTLL
jgi:hypothetical protein